ncbi:BaiN/RdsA family NAD(P)/FAD-dependent oxidoreductase [Defluviitalea phaphyphila]|uniref:NAD(P)/FAD-dependent oxidoreductase n=1 Tax=Defluviitalea phaphyphila TaxID=1473580 RepID=UPI00073146D1|nr:NAD(P)/FAD-dependent oxidoreductase [Defluviitalea phaphyphila]
MKKINKVLIIGGGASGLIAAISAKKKGAEVVILEKMNRVGKKILATGNGRCNLTNINMETKRFHSSYPKFVMGALNRFNVNQTLDFFERLGISYKIEDGGKVFPMSDQASSVLDVLRYEIQRLGIKEICEAEVTKIVNKNNKFILYLKDGRKFSGDRVIVATGGKSSPNLGSNGSGYGLVTPLGHKLITPFPALVQLVLEAWFLKRLKGVKFNGKISIFDGNKPIQTEFGEILFTDYGVSGPPVLQLSRKAGELLNNKKSTPFICIDLFPNFSEKQIDDIILTRFFNYPKKSVEFSFVGFINKRLIPVILKEAGIKDLNKSCCNVNITERKNIIKILKNWRIPVKGTQSWMQSQVTAGGIDVKDIDPNTMESKLVSGLYFSGEVLDVDGDCGGFNLQWAWSSGYIAGESAAKKK